MKRELLLLLAFSCIFTVFGQQVTDPEVLYRDALGHYRKQEYVKAQEDIERLIRVRPSAKGWYLRGLIHESLGNDLIAVADYETALKLDPDYFEALFQKALIYLNNGNPLQAIEDLDRLITQDGFVQTRGIYFQVDPSGEQQNQIVSLQNLKSRLYYYRARAHSKLEKYELALSDYQMAISIDSLPDYFVGRSLIYSGLNQMESAQLDLKIALDIDSMSATAWYNLALINPSVRLPTQLIGTEGFAPVLGLLAARAFEEGRWSDAVKLFDQALINDSSQTLSYINRGRALLKLGEYAEARDDFEQARVQDPTRFESIYLIGHAFFHEGDFSMALIYYDEFLTIDPTSAETWYNGALCHIENKNYMEGCHYLAMAIARGMKAAEAPKERYCQ